MMINSNHMDGSAILGKIALITDQNHSAFPCCDIPVLRIFFQNSTHNLI